MARKRLMGKVRYLKNSGVNKERFDPGPLSSSESLPDKDKS
ncbi:MAG: hypothetical protein ACOY46_19095 [Bacillota bacterium]